MSETKEASAVVRRHQTVTGTVTSARMAKTVVVSVERLTGHPMYDRSLRRTRRFMAHDEKGECKVGDRVLIVETRPLSKQKRWRVRRVINRAAAE